MTDTPQPPASTRWSRVPLAVFAVLFTLFAANVLLGKARISFGWDVPFLLGDVAEFLLLLAASTCFVLAGLGRERDSGA